MTATFPYMAWMIAEGCGLSGEPPRPYHHRGVCGITVPLGTPVPRTVPRPRCSSRWNDGSSRIASALAHRAVLHPVRSMFVGCTASRHKPCGAFARRDYFDPVVRHLHGALHIQQHVRPHAGKADRSRWLSVHRAGGRARRATDIASPSLLWPNPNGAAEE